MPESMVSALVARPQAARRLLQLMLHVLPGAHAATDELAGYVEEVEATRIKRGAGAFLSLFY